MKEVKIFLASSIVEFERERNQLVSYINQLNDQYVKRGIYFNLVICENLPNAISLGRKQEEYNEVIRSSRYVWVLVGERMGDFTEEEFDVALDQFVKTGSPSIHTYFKKLPEGRNPDESVLKFLERLNDNLGHYYDEYENIDSIKLNMIMEITRDPDIGGLLKFEDGQAKIDGVEMVSIENLPSYRGNADLAQKREEIKRLDKEHTKLKLEYAIDQDDDILDAMQEIANKRSQLQEEVQNIEDAVLASCNLIMDSSKKDAIDWHEEEALELMSAGRFKQAASTLSDKQWDSEALRKNEIGDTLRAWVDQYISGKRTLALCLQAQGVNEKRSKKIIAAYEAGMQEACRWGVGISIVFDYLQYLIKQRLFFEAETVGRKYLMLAELHGAPVIDIIEANLRTYQAFSNRHLYREAEIYVEQALSLAAEHPIPESLQVELEIRKYYSDCDLDLVPLEQLIEYLHNTLNVHDTFFKQDIPENLNFCAEVKGCLAGRYRANKEYELARKYREESLEIREHLAQSGEEQFLRKLALTLNHLANLLSKDFNEYDKALEYHLRALDIRQKGMEQMPSVYTSGVGVSLANVSDVLRRMGRLEEAEDYARQALKIRSKLFEDDPVRFASAYCFSLIRVANVLRDLKNPDRYSEAEMLYQEALAIRKDEYERLKTKASAQSYGRTLNEYGDFLNLAGRNNEAEEISVRANALLDDGSAQ